MADLLKENDSEVVKGYTNTGEGHHAQIVVAVGDQIKFVTATIANGASISGDIDLAMYRLVRIDMPAAWTAANITFQTSYDGATWNSLYDSSGVEYTVTAAQARAILLPAADLIGVRWLRVRSGTSAATVAQGANRNLILVLAR